MANEQEKEEFETFKKTKVDRGILDQEESILAKIIGKLAQYKDDIVLFFSLLKDYFGGRYDDISKANIAIIIGTLMYILTPIDLIPDFIPFAGLTDDAAMVALCLQTLHNELEKYKLWKAAQKN